MLVLRDKVTVTRRDGVRDVLLGCSSYELRSHWFGRLEVIGGGSTIVAIFWWPKAAVIEMADVSDLERITIANDRAVPL